MSTYAAKHTRSRKSLRDAFCKCVRRYGAAHKPVHVAVTSFIFCVEVAALFLTHALIVHLTITTVITLWEMLVIGIAESE